MPAPTATWNRRSSFYSLHGKPILQIQHTVHSLALSFLIATLAVSAEEIEIDGPPPPISPEVFARDEEGRVTMRAIRLSQPLTLDGLLDESVYENVPPVNGFIQQEPNEGATATEDTDLWVLFDDKQIYIAARCWDSQADLIMANEMRRDNIALFQNDNFAVVLDTFYDRRNAFVFHINPLAGLMDAQVFDESLFNRDWNTVWDARTARFDKGWTLEIAVPFKSLRYKGSGPQVWGINVRRIVRSKNEMSHITPIPRSWGNGGVIKMSSAATLVGLETPQGSQNIELRPYLRGDTMTDLEVLPAVTNEIDGDWGVDFKYGLTRSLTFDFTYNTDFAEVEVDEQQVNLTRFGLIFPEKRDFFLEGQGIFSFGIEGGRGTGPPANTPVVFFSRRIGLQDELAIPIIGGGRLTGTAGPYQIGLLHIRTEAFPIVGARETDFSVVRLKRDFFGRSNVGVIFTRRAPRLDGNRENLVYGIDADLGLSSDTRVHAYYAKSDTPELEGIDESYRVRLNYGGDRYGVQVERMRVGPDFNPEVGFVSRRDFDRSFASFRFSPRPQWWGAVRRLNFQGSFDYITNTEGTLETRIGIAGFLVDFENSDQSEISYQRNLEFLAEPFEISDGIVLPVGTYRSQEIFYRYGLGFQRKLSGNFFFVAGTFYNGERIGVGYNGRVELAERLSLEPGIQFNRVDLVEGNFTTELLTARVNYSFSPRVFLGALLQYNSTNETVGANLRFRWQYQPESDLFVVYTDGRDILTPGLPQLLNRSLVIKLTKLFRF